MKGSKIYIIAAICFFAGLAVFTAGFAMAGFDISAFDSSKDYEERIFTAETEILKISVRDRDADISVIASEDGKARVTCFENDELSYEIGVSGDGTLTVERKDLRDWYERLLNFGFRAPKLTIEVPKEFSGEIYVKNSNGDMTVKDLSVSDLTFITSNGTLTSEGLTVSGSVRLESSNGDLGFRNSSVSGSINCDTGNGVITIDEVTARSFEAESSNGRLNLKRLTVSEGIDAETSNGRITLEEVSFGTELNCETSNGDIKGSVRGSLSDFSFYCETSNGDSNLPAGLKGGEKIIRIETSNGDINIDLVP